MYTDADRKKDELEIKKKQAMGKSKWPKKLYVYEKYNCAQTKK
jgi:hypothetical protein